MSNKMRMRSVIAAGAIIALLSLSSPVQADPPPGKGWRAHEDGYDREPERPEHPEVRHEVKKKHHRTHNIVNQDRIIINSYLEERVRPRFCPPGLAKKHDGCIPPGQAHRYRMGQPLPEQIVIEPLPQEVLVRLHPPTGYYYTQVDGDVLLVNEASKKIIDAVTLLSAVH